MKEKLEFQIKMEVFDFGFNTEFCQWWASVITFSTPKQDRSLISIQKNGPNLYIQFLFLNII